MRTLSTIALFVFLFILSMTATAQTSCPEIPGGATATYKGSFTIELALSTVCSVRCDVCTWFTPEGRADLALDAGSIRFSDNPDGAEISTVTLFGLLSQTAIARAYTLGHITPSNDCVSGTSVRVYQAACVQRYGSGAFTQFVPCDPSAFSARIYKLCLPGDQSTLNVALTGTEAATCSGGSCQATCP